MLLFAWIGMAEAAQTDCVTKDLGWRWLSTTADASPAGAKAGDRWVHGSKVVAEQAPGATGRLSWTADEASKVPFRTSQQGGDKVETFKWKVTLSATDGKPIAADVSDTKLELTMHCQRVTAGAGGTVPAAKPAAAAGAKPAGGAKPAAAAAAKPADKPAAASGAKPAEKPAEPAKAPAK
jgi:hypothetical protein